MIRSDYVQSLEQERDALRERLEATEMGLTMLEDFVSAVRAACAGQWYSEPVHRMRQVVAALEMVR